MGDRTSLASALPADVAWPTEKVVVEVDGDEHRARLKWADDRLCDNLLQRNGYKVLRYPNDRVASDLAGVHPPPRAKPALHARLRLMLEERIEDQVRRGFRAIAARHPVAALNRLRKATTGAGLVQGEPKRKLILLRNIEWNSGAKTQEALYAFREAGGLDLPISTDDLRTLWALQKMVDDDHPNLQAWLVRRPTGR